MLRRHFFKQISIVFRIVGASVMGGYLFRSSAEALTPMGRVGRAYLLQFPLLAAEDVSMSLNLKDKNSIQSAISEDFESGNIVIVSGWVLSRTECKICAHAQRATGASYVA